MTRLVIALLAGLLLSAAVIAVDITVLPNAELQERYENLTRQLRCMQCQNNSIADSPVDLAADLRKLVKEQLIAGKSDQEILDYMANRYGNYILFTPPMEPATAWIWILPGLAALAGLFIGFRIVRRRSALADTDDGIENEETSR
jgi:cytochrome c-type biogenesis protein CcmH